MPESLTKDEIIKKVEDVLNKKGITFPPSYIEQIAEAYIRRELTDKELDTLIDNIKNKKYHWAIENLIFGKKK